MCVIYNVGTAKLGWHWVSEIELTILPLMRMPCSMHILVDYKLFSGTICFLYINKCEKKGGENCSIVQRSMGVMINMIKEQHEVMMIRKEKQYGGQHVDEKTNVKAHFFCSAKRSALLVIR